MKRIGLIIFVLLVFYFLFLIREDFSGNRELEKEIKFTSQRIEAEKEKNRQLNKKLAQLNDQGYIEGLARSGMGLIKPGETPYKIVYRR